MVHSRNPSVINPGIALVLAGSGILYLTALFPFSLGSYAYLWWIGLLIYSLMVIAVSRGMREPIRIFQTWLIFMLLFPKRNPNGNFVTWLNAWAPEIEVPVVQIIGFVLSIGCLVSVHGLRSRDNVSKASKLWSQCGLALIVSGVCSLIACIRNQYVMADLLLHYRFLFFGLNHSILVITEGIIVLCIGKLAWDDQKVKTCLKLGAFGLVVGAGEFLLWMTFDETSIIGRYLADFRGGFRSIINGLGGGTMMGPAGVFVVSCFVLGVRNRIITIMGGLLAMIIAISSLHRTTGFAVALTFMLSFIFSRRLNRAATLLVFASSLGIMFLAYQSVFIEKFKEIDYRKGRSYFSLESMNSRFILSVASIQILQHSPVVGTGIGGLGPYLIKYYNDRSYGFRAMSEMLADANLLEDRIFDAHVLVVSLLSSCGIGGLLSVIVLVACLWHAFLKGFINGTGVSRVMFIGVAGSVFCYLPQAEPYIVSYGLLLGRFCCLYGKSLPAVNHRQAGSVRRGYERGRVVASR